MASIIAELVFALGFGRPDTRELDGATKKGEEGAKKVERAWDSAGRNIGKAFAVIGAAAIGTAGSVFALVNSATEAGDAAAKAARSIGTTATEMQRLQFAAQRGGVAITDVSASVGFLNKNLNEARLGGAKPFIDSLKLVGLTTEDLRGSSEENLGVIADALGRIDDEGERSALTMDLLGKSGRNLASVLSSGSAGIKAAGDEAERLGLVLGKDALDASEAYQDSLLDMKRTIGAVKNEIGIELIPIVKDIVDSTKDWVLTNREFIKSNIKNTIDALINVFRGLVPILTATVGTLTEIVNWFGESENAAIRMVPAITAMGVAVTAAAGPWGALAAAIMLVITNLDTVQNKMASVLESELRFLGIGPDHDALEAAAGGRSRYRGQPARAVALAAQGSEYEAHVAMSALSDADLAAIAASETGLARDLAAATMTRRQRQRAEETDAGDLGAEARRRAARAAAIRASRAPRREADIDYVAEVFDFDEEFGDEIRRLAQREGLGDKAVNEALKAGGEALRSGSLMRVAKSAALSRLGSFAGTSFDTQPSDRFLSEILGDENVPDIALSSIARGAEPQVLVSTINNTFNFENQFDIDGAGDPVGVGDAVAFALREVFESSMEKTTKTSKVSFAR